MRQQAIFDTLSLFIPLAVGLTAVLFVNYVNSQQILREGANEPQLWLAHDTANGLANDLATTTNFGGGAYIPIEASLAPYIEVYDASGNPIVGTGYLHDKLPTIPLGVFESARSLGEDRLTWQPEPGVRQAIVVVPIPGGQGGFVLAGRSLVYIEEQEKTLTLRTCLGWVATMAVMLIALVFVGILRRK